MSEIKGPVVSTHVAAKEGAKAPETQQLKAESIVLTAAETTDRAAVNPNAPTLVLEKPAIGQAVTVVWIVGTQIDFKFDVNTAKVVAADGSTTFVFADGATLKVVGLEVGAEGLPETPVTLADGAVVGLDEIAGLSGIAPGGQPPAPAAGGNQPGNQGHAATPVDPGDVGNGLLDTGGLKYTELHFTVPELKGDNVEDILEDTGPTLSINDVTVVEPNLDFEGGFGQVLGNRFPGQGGNSLINGLGGPEGFGENFLARNDDGSTTFVDVTSIFPDGMNFFGTNFTGFFINNNGNITFNSPLSTFTPFALTGATNNPMIAPFFADVDTRGGDLGDAGATPGGNSHGSNLLWFDFDEANGVITITWDDVGYFGSHTDKLNAFQLVIYNTGNGNFAFEFRYENVDWTTGDASGGEGGLGGVITRAGFNSGNGTDFFELPQSGNQAAILGLEGTSNDGTPQDGNWVFNVVGGEVVDNFVIANFTVTLSEPQAVDVSVNFHTVDGTAVAGQDYLETHGTLIIPAGSTTGTIPVIVLGDNIQEILENFTVVLDTPVNATIADPVGVGTIIDNSLPDLSISDATATEGDPLQISDGHFLLGDDGSGGEVAQIYRVELDGTVTVAVSNSEIAAAVQALGAQTGSGFSLDESGIVEDANGNIFFTLDGVGFFGGGDNQAFFSQNPIFVKLAGSGEIQLVISANDVTNVTDGQADPEDLAMASDGTLYFVNNPQFFEGQPGSSEILRILDPLGQSDVQVVTNTNQMTDALLDEFGGSLNSFLTDVGITISADGSTLFVPFEAEFNSDGEGGVDVVAGVFAIDAATGDIENIFSDPQITGPEYITLAPNGDLIVADEGSDQIYRIDPNTGVVTVFVTKAQIQAVTDEADLEGGIAFDADGNFYVAEQDGDTVIKFPAVNATEGTIDADAGVAFVQQGDISALSGGSPDLSSDLTFVAGAGTGDGDDPNTTITFTVSLSAASAQAVTVQYTVLPGTAVEGNPSLHEGDYSAIDPLTGTVTFAAGETSKTITLNVVDDFLAEDTENFTVVLSNPVNAGIADGTGVGTIFDNDEETGVPALLISDASAIEGQELTFNLSLTQASLETIVVQLASTDGGSSGASTTEGTDYPTLDNVLVTFLPGETLHSLSISAFEDSTSEPDERFTVSASGVTGTVNTGDTGEGLITDNDVSALTIDNATAVEGNQLSFALTLSNPSSEDLVFEFTTTSGSATEGTDFTSGDGVRVTFLAGQTGATLTINSTADNTPENTEDFSVSASVVTGNAVAADGAEGFITDDDASISLNISDATAIEGDPLTFNLSLSGTSAQTIIVQLSTTDGSAGFASASENSDYNSIDGQLVTFLPGEQLKSVIVTSLEDGIFEPSEAFTVSAAATQGAVNTTDTGRGVITNDDPVPQLTIGGATASEGDQLVFNLTLSNPSAENIVFSFQTLSGLAVEGTDFVSGDGQKVTFLAGQTTSTITIDTIEDTLAEPTEEMNLTATVSSGTATVANFAEGFITNDDFAPTGGPASGSVSEAGVEGNAPGSPVNPFSEGSDPASNSEIASGQLNLSFGPDGPAANGAFTWSTTVTVVDSDDGNAPVLLKSDGHAVNTVVSGNGLTLDFVIADGPDAGAVVARLTATPGAGPNAGATFNYEQFGNFDHPDEGQSGALDPLQLGFSYTIKDATGDSANGSLAITVADDAPTGLIEKSATITSGANAFNIAFVLDVSDSMDDTVDGGGTRLELALTALKNLLNQANDAGAVGPVLIVAFDGVGGGENVAPHFSATTFASADAAIAGLENFIFNEVLDGQAAPLPSFPFPLGGTRYEGGLDAATDWLRGNPVSSGGTNSTVTINHAAQNVASADNRVFLLTDGGNNSGNGGFDPDFRDVEHLYTNIGPLASDIPNLTIRSVGIDIDQAAAAATPGGTPEQIAAKLDLFTRDLDQTDDNLINGSISLVDSEQGAEAITGGFGNVNPTGTITGNLFIDDNGVGATPGADALEKLASVTILNGAGVGDDVVLTINSPGAVGGIVSHATALGGSIEIDFNTGAFTYTAPANLVTAVDGFTFSIEDGDGDPLGGTLNISLAPGNGIEGNAGFETDTLRFWSAAGSVWVSDSAGIPGQSEGQFFAVLHTGNDNALTPSADRDIPSDTELEAFIGAPGLDLDAVFANPTLAARDGAALKGVFELDPAPSQQFDVSFDWQFLTDHDNTTGQPNDFAFVVIEGQLFMLANSDNAGSPVASVLASQNLTVDGQQFTNATAFQNDTTFTVTDSNNDGVVNIAFGVVNGGSSASAASALIIDDVQVVPHVV